KSQQAERPVFATTSAFNVLYHFSGIKKPAQRRALLTLPSRKNRQNIRFMRKIHFSVRFCNI
ncbi:TPA: hypothetical protein ACM385_005018, partial [Escherichia coli]